MTQSLDRALLLLAELGDGPKRLGPLADKFGIHKSTALRLLQTLEKHGFVQRRGDPPEFTLKIKISYKYEEPAIYFLKGNRRFRATEEDLVDIKRSTCERIDVICSPSRWVQPDRTGVTAYVKEMYVKIRESRFAEMYSDYDDADGPGPTSEEDAE